MKLRCRYILIFIILALFLFGCQKQEVITDSVVYGELTVHYIDIGQGDAILVICGSEAMLIDTGEGECFDRLSSYLSQEGITKIKYLVATHPHSDHIGSMDKVIEGYDIENIFMPRVEHTTKTFENMLDAAIAKGHKIKSPEKGTTFGLDEAIITVLGPTRITEDNLNNSSIVLRLEYGSNSFLFTGDAEKEAEEDVLVCGISIKSDVLKVAHHGSNTSTTKEFLYAVNPKIAVISAGAGNAYGHPSEKILERLSQQGATVYRTDLSGTIVIKSDGRNIKVKTGIQDLAAIEKIEQPKAYYIGNKNSKKFHVMSCSSLPKKENQTMLETRKDALAKGFTPCGTCDP